MKIIWDERKNELLKAERSLSFEVFTEMIMENDYEAVLENPAREGQKVFLCRYKGYIHVVPFVLDDDGNIVLKTIFPSRKFDKLYGGDSND